MTGATQNESQEVSFDARIVLRPRTLDETLDLALAYMRSSAREFAVVSLWLVSIASALVIALGVVLQFTAVQTMGIALLVAPVVEQIVTVYGGSHIFRNRPSLARSTATVLKRLPRVLIASALITLPWTPLFFTDFDGDTWAPVAVLLGSVWPFLLASQAYRAEVSLLEQLPMRRTGERTRALVAYRFGRALGMLAVTAVIRVSVALAVWMTASFLLEFVLQFEEVSDFIGAWPIVVGYLLVAPYISMARMFDYVDARTRREGWDIQVRFNAIAQDAAREALGSARA